MRARTRRVLITMVGLDVCEQTHLDVETVRALADAPSALGRFVADATTPWLQVRQQLFDSMSLHLYDSLAVAAACRPPVSEKVC